MAGREGRGPSPLKDFPKLPVPLGEGGEGLLLRGEGLGVAGVVSRGEVVRHEVLEDEAEGRGLLGRADEDGEATLELVVAFAIPLHGLNRDEDDGGGGGSFHVRGDRYERRGLKALPEQGLL